MLKRPYTCDNCCCAAPQALGAVNESNNITKWIGVVVMLLAVVMNMSSVDSLQVRYAR